MILQALLVIGVLWLLPKLYNLYQTHLSNTPGTTMLLRPFQMLTETLPAVPGPFWTSVESMWRWHFDSALLPSYPRCSRLEVADAMTMSSL